MLKHRKMYQAQMAQRVGELTKDLDAFYTIFIKQFHSLEREIVAMRQSGAASAATLSAQMPEETSLVTP